VEKKFIFMVALLLAVNSSVFALESKDVQVDFSLEPEPMVGVPTDLSFTVKDAATGKPINDVEMALEIVIVEDAFTLFSGDFYLQDGKLELTYHFQDATEHAINLRITPTALSEVQFQPIEKTFLTEVTPPEPPKKIWFKTWVFLMGLLVLGIAIGFYAVKFRANKMV